MPRVLIAGCGYLGAAAAKLFINDSWQVTGWSRSGRIADAQLAKTLTIETVDLTNADDIQRHAFSCDIIVHCASTRGGDADEYRRVYLEGVQNLRSVFPNARLIFTSSTSVYGQRDGSWADENSPAEATNEKSRTLREAEECVLAGNGVVLRLGGIYGPQRSFLLHAVAAGRISGGRERYVNQIHRDDAASAIHFVATKQPFVAGIFNVVDDTPAPRGEILSWLAMELRRPPPQTIPESSTRRGDSNKRVSNAKLRELGWSPKYASYREGFVRSVIPAAEELQN